MWSLPAVHTDCSVQVYCLDDKPWQTKSAKYSKVVFVLSTPVVLASVVQERVTKLDDWWFFCSLKVNFILR